MSDIVVTVPINFRLEFFAARGLDAWIAEGDAAGEPDSGRLWCFRTGGMEPNINPGDRVYIVCEDRLRGYAPLVKLDYCDGEVKLYRRGGAVAVTIPGRIIGFRGWRYRWWTLDLEVPFPDWQTTDRRHRQPCARLNGQRTLFQT